MKNCAVVLMIGFCYIVCFAGYKTYLSLTHPLKYENEIVEIANIYNLSPALVASVVNVESGYNKNAISKKGALGLMQVKLSTADFMNSVYNKTEKLNQTNLLDEKTNLHYGCMYLKYLIKKFDDVFTALAAYNAGETIVRLWLEDENYSLDKLSLRTIPFKETNNYVKKIKSNLAFYKKVY